MRTSCTSDVASLALTGPEGCVKGGTVCPGLNVIGVGVGPLGWIVAAPHDELYEALTRGPTWELGLGIGAVGVGLGCLVAEGAHPTRSAKPTATVDPDIHFLSTVLMVTE
ncbi:MAG: hypothetical protein ACP5OR_00935 [Candidatus Dormibacteria bacterium]